MLFLAAALVAAVLGHFISFSMHLATLLFLVLFVFGVHFFRDPEREIAEGVACPADGKIRVVRDDEARGSPNRGLDGCRRARGRGTLRKGV